MNYEACKKELEKRLKARRFRHSCGTAEAARFLAERFGIDTEKARLAGLLHDCAREFSDGAMIDEAEKRGVAVGDVERMMPLLLHAPLGAFRVSEIYGVEDAEIKQAIARHTVGCASMKPLDKIIYFADMIEPTREYPGVEELRRAAREESLNAMMLAGLRRSILFVLQKGQLIHPDTVAARNDILLVETGRKGKFA